MDFDAPVKVELDTKKAKQQARDLTRSRVRSKKKQTEISNRRSPISSKLASLAGGVSGYSAVNRILHSSGGLPSPWDAWKRPVEALMQQHIDANLGGSVRAKTTALDRTQRKLGFAAGVDTQPMAPIEEYYKRSLLMQDEVEAGRNILRADPQFAGVNLVDLLKQSVEGYMLLLRRSFGYIGDAFTGK